MSDGSVKYVNAIAHGSRDVGGRLEYIGAVQDVTHRRMSSTIPIPEISSVGGMRIVRPSSVVN